MPANLSLPTYTAAY